MYVCIHTHTHTHTHRTCFLTHTSTLITGASQLRLIHSRFWIFPPADSNRPCQSVVNEERKRERERNRERDGQIKRETETRAVAEAPDAMYDGWSNYISSCVYM